MSDTSPPGAAATPAGPASKASSCGTRPDEVPRQRRDRVGETFGRVVAGPAWLNGGHRPRLELIKPVPFPTPLDVLRPAVMAVNFFQELSHCVNLFIAQAGPVGEIASYGPLLDSVWCCDDHALLVADGAFDDV